MKTVTDCNCSYYDTTDTFKVIFISLLVRWFVKHNSVSLLTLLTAEIIKWQKCAGMGLNGFYTR